MSKGIHRLSESAVRIALDAGAEARLPDGGGLRLDIKGGTPSWLFRYVAPGSRRERYMGLGSGRSVSLNTARQLAAAAREVVKAGKDPIVERDNKKEAESSSAAEGAPTFEIAAERYIAKHEAGWKNAKHKQQWRNSLATYAYPKIGSKLVSQLDSEDIVDMLAPIWMKKKETASRIRSRVEAILDAARALKQRTEENPARLQVLKHLLPQQKRKSLVKHHAALPYSQMPLFWRTLSGDGSNAALALRFLILTAARYNEAAFARWSELDIKRGLWSIPQERMKADRPHVVPLSDAAVAQLKEARNRFGENGLVFPGNQKGKPLSDAAFSQAVDRNSIEHATTHGFRSTFRDWAGDKTQVQREVIEAALAHVIGDKAEAAYRRETALEKRTALMTAWSKYCASDAS